MPKWLVTFLFPIRSASYSVSNVFKKSQWSFYWGKWLILHIGRRDYETYHPGHKRESCVSDCSSYGDDPYCAGGKTFKNKCLMYNAVCTDGIAPGTKGACGKYMHE